MAYTFTKDLETGNALIDSEHRQLFDAINNLLEACSEGKGRANLESTAQFLLDYTKKHFADEEKLQLQTKYPDYQNHKRYHSEFVKTVKDLVDELHREGPTIAMVGKVNKIIAGWLINHIKREDVKIAQHIKAQNA